MIKYKDEKDKCYGIAGMAIGISIWNGENLLYKIDLDDEANDYITFTSDFYFSGNPALPPVESWHQTLKRYQMTIGMLIANMMCRAFPTGGLKYQDVEDAIFETVAEEGRHSCQLDDDEIKTFSRRLFLHGKGFPESIRQGNCSPVCCKTARMPFVDKL